MKQSNPKPDPEYSEAVKQWADEMGAMSEQQPESILDDKQNKNSSIMKWVKASERLPEKEGWYITLSTWPEKTGPIIPDDRSDSFFSNGKFAVGSWEVLEWLDESPSGETLEAVSGFIEWAKEKRYSTIVDSYSEFLQQTGKPTIDTPLKQDK